MEKFLHNSTLIFETLDYAGLNYVLLFECLNKEFKTKFNDRNACDNINVRMRANYYSNASSLQIAKIEIKEITRPILHTRLVWFQKDSKKIVTSRVPDGSPTVHELSDLDYKFHRHGTFQNYVLISDDKVLFCGERIDDAPIGTVSTYQFSTEKWEKKPDLLTPRYYLGLAKKHNIVYAFGGNTSVIDPLPTAEAFDLGTETWSSLPDMPASIETVVACAWKSLIYITGCNVKPVYSYNPVSQEYTTTKLESPSITADKVLLPTADRLILVTSRHNINCLQGDGETGQEETLTAGTQFLFGHAAWHENFYYYVSHQGDIRKVDPVMLTVVEAGRIN